MTKLEYQIISVVNEPMLLQEAVRCAMLTGWNPVGGIGVTPVDRTNNVHVSQAMTKEARMHDLAWEIAEAADES